MKTILLLALCLSVFQNRLFAQYSGDTTLMHAFTANGTAYAIMKEKKSWTDAAACAVARGGKLAEIGSQEEQDAILLQLYNAGILASNSVAPDGGGASYLWIGGNDIASEGNWVWNGDNDQTTEPFWIGTVNGSAVGTMYTNWGNEPDNWNQQDGLGIAFTDWPLGVAGQWNDVDDANELYYIIEFGGTAAVPETGFSERLAVYPNPTNGLISVLSHVPGTMLIELISLSGEVLLTEETETAIDLSALQSGIYILRVIQNGKSTSQLIVRNE